ncbi:DUF2975 domain-containing protein [Microbacterium sp. C5A9]|uniref:DUF2975 domain-containing protein n=1 Tax=Microbacterium sp. C5A9 TaxID=2736663 RepID=UPI001F5220B7|nr:DUF2975 domain-containing protein [Microbacterium sp. C5A9]MCI1020390.1 DUF2975 domain-containing protein [Microbacterium sp. C5A9]
MSTTTATRSQSADAITVILFGAAAVVVTAISTVLRVLGTFRDQGIAWSIPIDEQPISATTDSGAGSVEGIAQSAMVFATGVDAVSTAAIIGSLVLWALAPLVVIAGIMLVAWNFLRGRFFVRGNARAFDAIGWTLTLAPMIIVLLENVGLNGVTAALGFDAGEPVHPIEFWSIVPFFAAGVAVGLIAAAFRQGIRLQRENAALENDTRGLV